MAHGQVSVIRASRGGFFSPAGLAKCLLMWAAHRAALVATITANVKRQGKPTTEGGTYDRHLIYLATTNDLVDTNIPMISRRKCFHRKLGVHVNCLPSWENCIWRNPSKGLPVQI